MRVIGSTLHKGSFGQTFVAAVATGAGLVATRPELDTGIDLSIQSSLNPDLPKDPQLDVQVKTSQNAEIRGDMIVHDLEVDAYEKLIKPSMIPRILVVVRVPLTPQEWLEVGDDNLVLRHCGYWVNLQGRHSTQNKSTIRLELPKVQRFDPVNLLAIMRRVHDGGKP